MAPKRKQSKLPISSEPAGGTEVEERLLVGENDTIYLVLGQTGAGKSTFLNHALGRQAASVGHGLDAHTSTIDPFLLTSGNPDMGRVFLVDTPGFNDTWDSDRAIVKRILDWLQTSCQPTTKFGGIIYLYEISQSRDNPTTNFMHPTKLSEPQAPKYVILATVKWNLVRRAAVAELRESQLKEFWSKMEDRGSQMARFEDSTESAHQILNMFPKTALSVERIQKEFRRILGTLPDGSGSKEGFISKLFGRISWLGW
ncbi:hypothetical protein DXG01_015399 [Tephrocybe rancida]|nr:hypothetical protein DXG01_015399 [Tephrocybe rancida]